MAVCSDASRRFRPTSDEYFEEAIEELDPEACLEREYMYVLALYNDGDEEEEQKKKDGKRRRWLDASLFICVSFRKINDPKFGWRALRVIGKSNLKYFQDFSEVQHKSFPDYLEHALKKMVGWPLWLILDGRLID